MPSAPPSSAESRNTPNAIAGSKNVVSATVRSVNQEIPPSINEGICTMWQAGETQRFGECTARMQKSCSALDFCMHCVLGQFIQSQGLHDDHCFLYALFLKMGLHVMSSIVAVACLLCCCFLQVEQCNARHRQRDANKEHSVEMMLRLGTKQQRHVITRERP